MRIGIITFHKSYNYGSVLQAYALQTYLINLGHDVNIIDYILTKDFQQYNLFRTYLYSIHPKAALRDLRRFPKNIRRKYNFKKFEKNNLFLSKQSYVDNADMHELNLCYDCFICGSDQIWNLDCTGGLVPAYFLNFADKNKKIIAYAPSIANASFESDTKEINELLDRFTAISVREKSTIPLVEKYSKHKIISTVDPTLLLDSCCYASIEKFSYSREYIFYYHLEDNEFMKNWCALFAQSLNMDIVYIYKDNIKAFKKSKNVYGCNPEEFLGYIHNAKFVVTNSFHATVFSILYKKKFVTFKTSNSSARMVDLLNALGVQSRIYNETFEMNEYIDYDSVFEKLEKYRELSRCFLKQSLE